MRNGGLLFPERAPRVIKNSLDLPQFGVPRVRIRQEGSLLPKNGPALQRVELRTAFSSHLSQVSSGSGERKIDWLKSGKTSVSSKSARDKNPLGTRVLPVATLEKTETGHAQFHVKLSGMKIRSGVCGDQLALLQAT